MSFLSPLPYDTSLVSPTPTLCLPFLSNGPGELFPFSAQHTQNRSLTWPGLVWFRPGIRCPEIAQSPKAKRLSLQVGSGKCRFLIATHHHCNASHRAGLAGWLSVCWLTYLPFSLVTPWLFLFPLLEGRKVSRDVDTMCCSDASNAGGKERLASLTAPLRRRYLHFYLLDTCLRVLCCPSPFVCNWLIVLPPRSH